MENSRLIENRYTSYTYVLSKPGDQGWEGTSIHTGNCGNPKTWAGKTQSFK